MTGGWQSREGGVSSCLVRFNKPTLHMWPQHTPYLNRLLHIMCNHQGSNISQNTQRELNSNASYINMVWFRSCLNNSNMKMCSWFVLKHSKYCMKCWMMLCSFLIKWHQVSVWCIHQLLISANWRNVTIRCLRVCTGPTETENYILSHTFLESKWSCQLSQFLFFLSSHLYQKAVNQKQRITIFYNEHAAVPAETAFPQDS